MLSSFSSLTEITQLRCGEFLAYHETLEILAHGLQHIGKEKISSEGEEFAQGGEENTGDGSHREARRE